MKKTLSMITLAAFAVMLLGSCSKINERIDDLEKKVDGLENEKIASINTQVEKINSSISDLGTIRSNIQSLTDGAKSQGQDITALQAADKALGSRIGELSKYVGDTLKAYATEEWVKATFSTLEQYKKTCDTIAKIDVRIGALDENLSKKIADCADSLTTWINGQFEGYYTAAEMDAKLGAMQDGIDAAKAANLITDAKVDSLAVELAKVQPSIDSAKATLTAEYTAAIDTAITALDGKLTKQIQDEIEKVNETVTALAQRVGILEFQVRDLLGRVGALEGMIQSVTIVPAFSDGSVELKDDTLLIDLAVTPKTAVANLVSTKVKILLNKVLTKAVTLDTVPTDSIKVFTKDAKNGTVSIKANIIGLIPGNDTSLTVAANVIKGNSDYTTEFVPVYESPYVVMNMGTAPNAYTLKWRKMNLGATTVAGSYSTCCGDYYAWGETEPYYSEKTWDASDKKWTVSEGKWKDGKTDGYSWKSYCNDIDFVGWSTAPYDVTTNILMAEYDAATVNLGAGWRMPTSCEFKALVKACGGTGEPSTLSSATPGQGVYWLSATQKHIPYYTGVAGLLFVDGDGNRLFFPAASYCNDTNFPFPPGSSGIYWSSSLDVPAKAYNLFFLSSFFSPTSLYEGYYGYSVRPVSD